MKHTNFYKNFKESINSISINKKELASAVLFLSILYAVSYISIFRANFSYVDDIRRAIEGNNISGAFSRYISNYLSWFIHTTDERVTDISPLPQLIACVFLAFAGYVLVKAMCNKPTKYILLATVPIGLSPYFLECISYKFDAPYMALSILASIVPFLFMHKNRWLYAGVSVVSLLIMTMTYQASSGIFLMMMLYFFFRTVLYKADTLKNAFIFLGISCASYAVALALFRLCIFEEVKTYVSTDLSNNHSIFSLFWHNISRYFPLVYKDLNVIWKITALVVIVVFYVKNIVLSKLNKIVAFFVTTLFLALLAASIFGVYVLLEYPLFNARAMYGVGVFLAILGVDICCSLKKIFSFPVIVLSWCFFVFAFAFGNCLADQKRYAEFRTEMLVRDLSRLLPEKTKEPHKFAIFGTIGHSAVVENVAHNNPVIKRLVPIMLRGDYPFTYFTLSPYHKFPLSLNRKLTKEETEEIPVVFDSFYHTIKMNDEVVVIILK